jgi:heme/copper-type cytochrome/quinol oxidase subunit 2
VNWRSVFIVLLSVGLGAWIAMSMPKSRAMDVFSITVVSLMGGAFLVWSVYQWVCCALWYARRGKDE